MSRLTGLFVLLSGGEVGWCSSCRLDEAQRGQRMVLVGPLADVPIPRHTHDRKRKIPYGPRSRKVLMAVN